jgi:hypothetical protein
MLGLGTRYTIPVPATAHLLHLCLHGVDVLQRPLLRMHPALDGRVLGGQAKGVPSDGVQDVVAVHVLEARQDIGDGVDSQMAQMQRARGVREHGQDVGVALGGLAQLVPFRLQLVPVRLPLRRERLYARILSSLLSLGRRRRPVRGAADAWAGEADGGAPPAHALQTEAHHDQLAGACRGGRDQAHAPRRCSRFFGAGTARDGH